MAQNYVWGKDPFKRQEKAIDFNVTEPKKNQWYLKSMISHCKLWSFGVL